MQTNSLLGKGIYSISEAARIIHTDARSLQRWIHGYTTQKTKQFSAPILSSPVLHIDDEDVLTFQQLIEVLFIHQYRKNHVSMPTIRMAAAYAAKKYSTDHPFAMEWFKTDGETFFELSNLVGEGTNELSEQELATGIKRSKFVFLEFVRPYFLDIEYEKYEAVRYWPRGKDKHIVIDPMRSFGQPIDSETKVPTNVLFGMYQKGDSAEVISRWYGVKRETVIAAIEFEQGLGRKAA